MEVGQTFEPRTYTHVLCGNIGLDPKLIPESVLADINRKKSKAGINETLLTWYQEWKAQQSKDVDIPVGDLALLRSLGSSAQLREVQSMRDNIRELENRIKSRFKDVQDMSITIFNNRMRLDQLLNRPNEGILEHVKAIVADGWYKYNSTKTQVINSDLTESGKVVVFETPPVVMKYFDKQQGIDLNINMGQYLVAYRPYDSRVEVLEYKDNIIADGYIHPHVSGGSICWGNAGARVAESIKDGNPKPMLDALKVILQNYNSESPYINITHIIAASKQPELANKLPETFTSIADWVGDEPGFENGYILCRGEALSSNALYADDLETEDEDGEALWEVRAFLKVRGNTRVDDHVYIKTSSGGVMGYEIFPPTDIIEWR